MALPESIKSKGSVTSIVAIVVTGLAFAWLWRGNVDAGNTIDRQAMAWYSDDDGKTWFSQDRRTVLPPFDHNGKKAYRAYVFTCDGGKSQFVGWLEGFSPDAIRMLEQAREDAKNGIRNPGLADALQSQGVMCKKPGVGDWMYGNDTRAKAVRTVDCPSGGHLAPVLP